MPAVVKISTCETDWGWPLAAVDWTVGRHPLSPATKAVVIAADWSAAIPPTLVIPPAPEISAAARPAVSF